jgi:hypothetical protein
VPPGPGQVHANRMATSLWPRAAPVEEICQRVYRELRTQDESAASRPSRVEARQRNRCDGADDLMRQLTRASSSAVRRWRSSKVNPPNRWLTRSSRAKRPGCLEVSDPVAALA